jgi:putative nucleotidyltransferase with HDIG domain
MTEPSGSAAGLTSGGRNPRQSRWAPTWKTIDVFPGEEKLARMSDQREKRVELILQQLEELPTLPHVAVRVLEVTGNEDSSVADVVRIIENDQSLTTRILQLVTRADRGVHGDVSTLDRAVSLLGFAAVRSAVLAVSVFHTLSENKTESGRHFNRQEFWKHSIAVASCAELLAEMEPALGLIPSEAFVCGLLHDIGKVALDTILPKSFNRVVEGADLLRGNLADLERSIIGLDHMVVGKRVAERWQLPETIQQVIWLHGQVPDALPTALKNAKMVNLITLADYLVREQHLGYSGNYTFQPRAPLLEALGLKTKQIDAAVAQLVTRIEPRAAALGLGQTSADALYQQAMAQANQELGRISTQLDSKNRRLRVRGKFFDALSAFQGELRADAAPQMVLHAIGQTAVETMALPVVAAFSLRPGSTYAETVLVNAAGELFDTTLIDCPGGTPSITAGDGPVQSVGNDLEWLVSALSPRLGGETRFWISLDADNRCIGGVVWGAKAGESERLGPQVQELSGLAQGWSLALRTSQIREESRNLSEQLAEANRRLNSAQNEILRSKTIITVGEMAAGAAHEMNNPLAVIAGRSQLLASQLTDPKLKHAATLIYEQSHRLSEIISELMDFAKPVPAVTAAVDLADLVGRSLHDAKMQSDPADRTVEVTLTDVPPVRVDETQVAAAVAELIENAIQATDPVKGYIEIHAAYDAGSAQVALTIADNGCGMNEQTLKRAFDPFFSSKAAGRRRGMGLPKALRWVESSGGSIRLESRPNQGTRSLVLLPAFQPPVGAEHQDEEELQGRKAAQ